MVDLAQRAFHLVCAKEYAKSNAHYERDFRASFHSMEKFVRRFEGRLDFQGKTILDVGSGLGSPAFLMARRGAARVLGVDIVPNNIAFAEGQRRGDYADVADRVEFRLIRDFSDLAAERFDIILSKDSFEHYDDPESFVPAMLPHLADGGQIVIGFGPLWKSPYGGHIKYMTRLPWAHLVFPERVIMRERRRFFPDAPAATFRDFVGGLNKMTLARFLALIRTNGLEPSYFRINASEHPLSPLLTAIARLPFAREYATFNIYGIWQQAEDRR
jgi:SAM-dependent methyltransferase